MPESGKESYLVYIPLGLGVMVVLVGGGYCFIKRRNLKKLNEKLIETENVERKI